MEMEKSPNIPFKLISATCEGNGIGINNDLPWRLKQEMAYFTRMTTATVDERKQNVLIMGRRTWESMCELERPFPDRISIVLTSRPKREIVGGGDDVLVCSNYDEAVEIVESLADKIESCWVGLCLLVLLN